jgi:hypothetical protein
MANDVFISDKFLIEFHKITDYDIKRIPENDFILENKWTPSKYNNYKVIKLKISKDYDDLRKIIPMSGMIRIQSFDSISSLKKKLDLVFNYSTKGIKIEPRNEDFTIIRPNIKVPEEFDQLPEEEWKQYGKLNKDNVIIQYNVKKIDKKYYHEDIYATIETGEVWCYTISQIAIYISNDLFI